MTDFNLPKTAMVMAAGYGTRLRPLTDTVPKPMVKVLGRPMIDVALDRLAAAGVERAVINLHHLGEVIRDHLKARKDIEIVYSEEPAILETGGGTKKALPLLEQAAEKAYGENRLVVATLRVKALRALHRDADAEKVVADVLEQNGKWFPEQVDKLKAALKS